MESGDPARDRRASIEEFAGVGVHEFRFLPMGALHNSPWARHQVLLRLATGGGRTARTAATYWQVGHRNRLAPSLCFTGVVRWSRFTPEPTTREDRRFVDASRFFKLSFHRLSRTCVQVASLAHLGASSRTKGFLISETGHCLGCAARFSAR